MNARDQQLSQSAAGQVEARLAQVIEAAPIGVVLACADGRIALVNAEVERMFGYARDELLGRSVDLLLPDRKRGGHPELRAQYARNPSRRAMGAGRELNGRHKDGRDVPIEIGLNPIDGPDGTMILATVVEISARRRMETMFRRVFEGATCGMVMVDGEGRMVMVNRHMGRTFGYAPGELYNQPLDMLLPERYRGGHLARIAQYRAAPEMRIMGPGRELTGLHKDGSEFPVEVGLNPVEVHGDLLVLATITDVSERKKLELQLRQANANLEEFTYVASHDLKSPLRGIADLAEWIGEDLGENKSPEVARNLERLGTRVKRMESLIEDLLAYARAGRAATESVQIDTAELIDGIIELLALPRGFQVTTSIRVAQIKAPRTPLETVLRNLISNAAKHHDRAEGRIAVEVAEADSYCVFSIADDGPGIPEKAQARVFKLFQTLTSSQRGSSGVGLAVTKRLVETHGGRIELQSRDGERGSVFRVWWPRFARRDVDE